MLLRMVGHAVGRQRHYFWPQGRGRGASAAALRARGASWGQGALAGRVRPPDRPRQTPAGHRQAVGDAARETSARDTHRSPRSRSSPSEDPALPVRRHNGDGVRVLHNLAAPATRSLVRGVNADADDGAVIFSAPARIRRPCRPPHAFRLSSARAQAAAVLMLPRGPNYAGPEALRLSRPPAMRLRQSRLRRRRRAGRGSGR